MIYYCRLWSHLLSFFSVGTERILGEDNIGGSLKLVSTVGRNVELHNIAHQQHVIQLLISIPVREL
jgi:hypothetical protein